MRAIVNADKNWGIGCENKLLVHIPSDMRFFRDHTTNNVVVMGRKTLESLPGGRPLADRDNIILSRDPGLRVKGAAVVHDVEELQALLSDIHTDTVYVTRVDYAYKADAFFPDLDADPEWELAEESEEQTCFDIEFTFCTYRKRQEE